jgi:hypothetical protein
MDKPVKCAFPTSSQSMHIKQKIKRVMRDSNKSKHHATFSGSRRDTDSCGTGQFANSHLKIPAPMSDRRRAEIEAKKARLAEIRKARADRERQRESDKRQEVNLVSNQCCADIQLTNLC